MCSIEKLLSDARMLVGKLRDHDNSADQLINQSQSLQKKIDAMKEYEEDLNQLNEIARHRPRATLVLGIAQENRQIRELQQENRELRVCLHEHQAALELIMNKYREQVLRFILNKKEPTEPMHNSEELDSKIEKICEMAAVMQKAIEIDDLAMAQEHEKLTQLTLENKGLRELLKIHEQFGDQQEDTCQNEEHP